MSRLNNIKARHKRLKMLKELKEEEHMAKVYENMGLADTGPGSLNTRPYAYMGALAKRGTLTPIKTDRRTHG